jgi:hypothetical protein
MLEKLTWEQIAPKIRKLNPKMAQAIDQVNPSHDLRLYKVRYPYGANLLQDGFFYLPNAAGKLVPIIDDSLASEIKRDLSYNHKTNPVSINLENTSEIFIKLSDRIIPYSLIKPGQLLGAWGVFDPAISHHPMTIWGMSSGSRSAFMLPKISDLVAHRRLQKDFNVSSAPPKNLMDHGLIFKELFASRNNNSDWCCEILFFSKQWFDHLDKPGWMPLKCYLLETIWKKSDFMRNDPLWNLIYSVTQKANVISPNPYVTNMVKQLFNVAKGALLSFVPANNNSCGPIDFIKSVYVDGSYQLKDYLPTIMVPHLFDASMPSYFAPSYSTAMEFSLKLNSRPSLITDLKQIQESLVAYAHGIINSELRLQDSLVYKMVSETEFKFYHSSPDVSDAMIPSANMPNHDLAFMQDLKKYPRRKFASTGPFVRACIGVAKK